MTEIGRWLLFVGIALVIAGGTLMIAGRLFGTWRLPGDIAWQRGTVKVFAPLGTMLLLSLLLTIILNVIARWRR